MALFTRLAPLAATLLLAFAPVSEVHAAPSALTVGPEGTHAFFAMRPLGGLERQADRLVAYLESVGLQDPGLVELRTFILDTVAPAKGKRPAGQDGVIRAMGLNPEGSFAFYVVPADGREREVMAFDVADPEAFVKVVTRLLEDDQWVEPGERPKKAKIERTKLPDGSVRVTAALDEWSQAHFRWKGGVLLFSPKGEGLASMALDGGRTFDVATRLQPGGDRVGLAFSMEPSRSAQHVARPEPWFSSVDRLVFTLQWGPEGADFWGEGELAEDVAEFLAVAKPGPAGERARGQMAGLVDAGTSLWLRYGLDVQAIWRLAETFLGDGLGEVQTNFKKEMGVDLRKDLVDLLTGDVLFASREGLADTVGVLGVADAGKAATTLTKLLATAAKSMGDRSHMDTQWSQSGTQRLYRTRVWDGDAKRADVRDEFVFYWGTRDSGLVFGLTPQAIEATLAKTAGPGFTGEGLLAGRAFSGNAPLASYQLHREPFNLMRQILPILRSLMPAAQANPTGRVVRSIEAVQALYDRLVDSSSLVEVDGRTVRFRSEARALPAAGGQGWNAAADAAFSEGLRARYQGLVRTSNERLLDVATQFAGTPWAQKGRAYALAGDGGASLLFLMGGWSSFLMMARMTDYDDHEYAVPAYDPCQDLEARACHPGGDDQLCRVARAGVEGDCAAALAGSPP